MKKQKLAFKLLYSFLSPFQHLPHRAIHQLGNLFGSCLYYCHTKFRKRALSNLALAKSLNLSEKELKKVAKKSFQNLLINCLEFSKFSSEKDISKSIICENPQLAESFIKKGQGIVFFCGHQSNWEVLFLDGTRRMPGVAIGRPIKNPYLYHWILSIRERFGGKVISPKNAIQEGFRSLKKGLFLGVVGDQGMPESGFQSSFLGRTAWTSPAPALLAYKAKCPIMVATTRRKHGRYYIKYSDPIWPNFENPIEEEVSNLMKKSLEIFEKSVQENPGEWLWQHNRWKQETPKNVYYRFRYDSILIILPDDHTGFHQLLNEIQVFKEIYPLAFLTIMAPKPFFELVNIKDAEIIPYNSVKDLLVRDYRFKLVFNLSSYSVKNHFLSLSAMQVLSRNDLLTHAKEHLNPSQSYTFSEVLKRAICRPGTLWEKEHAS